MPEPPRLEPLPEPALFETLPKPLPHVAHGVRLDALESCMNDPVMIETVTADTCLSEVDPSCHVMTTSGMVLLLLKRLNAGFDDTSSEGRDMPGSRMISDPKQNPVTGPSSDKSAANNVVAGHTVEGSEDRRRVESAMFSGSTSGHKFLFRPQGTTESAACGGRDSVSREGTSRAKCLHRETGVARSPKDTPCIGNAHVW